MELHIPALSPEEGIAYTCLSLHCISAGINTAGRSNVTESERTGVQPNIWEVKCTESGTKQHNVTELVRGSMDRAARPRYRTNLALRTARTNLTSTALIS